MIEAVERLTPERCMERALALARESAAEGEVPVGAVLVLADGRPVCEGRNRSGSGSPLAHAELEALQGGLALLGRHGLQDTRLYVTLEPCLMCLGAMIHARIGGLVFGCHEPRFGGVAVLQALWKEGRYPYRFPVLSGPGGEEAKALLQDFFRARRRGP